MITANRARTLLRRSVVAARLGFLFMGTTKTRFPSTVKLGGKTSALSAPDEYGYLDDVINIWLDDEYGLKRLSEPPRTIVDLGANIGLFSLWAAHCFPEAVIHAYEPNARIIPYTKANLRGSNVKLYEEGVGARQGKARMVDQRESRMASTSESPEGDVEITSLATVIDRIGGHVDLIKIDCEGAEWDILKDRASLTRVRNVRMEYHLVRGTTMADLQEYVREIDFNIDELLPNQGFGIAWLSRKTLLGP